MSNSKFVSPSNRSNSIYIDENESDAQNGEPRSP
jgi:hypothetical protein